MARKKIEGTTEKIIRLSDEIIYKLEKKALKKRKKVKNYIEEHLSQHAVTNKS